LPWLVFAFEEDPDTEFLLRFNYWKSDCALLFIGGLIGDSAGIGALWDAG